MDYREDRITAKDIILPPFPDNSEDSQSNFTIVEVKSSELSKSLD